MDLASRKNNSPAPSPSSGAELSRSPARVIPANETPRSSSSEDTPVNTPAEDASTASEAAQAASIQLAPTGDLPIGEASDGDAQGAGSSPNNNASGTLSHIYFDADPRNSLQIQAATDSGSSPLASELAADPGEREGPEPVELELELSSPDQGVGATDVTPGATPDDGTPGVGKFSLAPASPKSPDMASSSSSSSRQDRGYHQDYIARIRYSNALPPPDMPPKLLPIPGEGVSSAQYTSPAFAARMAREQPMNIEADSELGMPLDLIGMPGVFDGDESSIMAPEHPPPPHPDDLPLLRPLASLGKPTAAHDGISFLRRTEYISAVGGNKRKKAKGDRAAPKQRAEDVSQDDPVDILRTIEHSFDVANPESVATGPDTGKRFRGHPVTKAEREAWDNPQHPTKKGVRPLDYYPLLPDLDAFPDSGGYIVVTFKSQPLGRDVELMEVALLKPKEPQDAKVMEDYQEAVTAHRKDETQPSPGVPPFDYDLYVPQDVAFVEAIKKKFGLEWAGDSDGQKYRYTRARTYEPTGGKSGKTKYGDVVVTLYDPTPEELATGKTKDGKPAKQKGAYYYPVLQKVSLAPKRDPNISAQAGMMGVAGSGSQRRDEGENIDALDLTLRGPSAEEIERRETYKREVDPLAYEEDDDEDDDGGDAAAGQLQREVRADADADGEPDDGA